MNLGKIGIKVIIRAKLHTVLIKPAAVLSFENSFSCKKEYLFHRYYRIGKNHRAILYIAAPQIEKPGNIIKGGKQMDVRSLCFHFLPHPLKFFFCTKAAVAFLKQKSGMMNQRRAIRPDFFCKIKLPAQTSPFLFQNFLEASGLVCLNHSAVKSETLSLKKVCFQILLKRRHPRLSHLHQQNAGACELLPRLNKVSAIRKKSGLTLRHHQRTGRACKAAEIFSHHKKAADIFTVMIVRCRNQIAVYSGFFHAFTQLLQSFPYHTVTSLFPCPAFCSAGTFFLKYIALYHICSTTFSSWD